MPYPYQSGIYQQNLQQLYQPNQLMNQPQQLVNQPGQLVNQSDAIFVSGISEALSWVVQRGQTVRLWDSNEPKFYIKSVGDNGMPNPLEIYRYERVDAPVEKEKTEAEYITRKEFEERIAALAKPQRKRKEADDEYDV